MVCRLSCAQSFRPAGSGDTRAAVWAGCACRQQAQGTWMAARPPSPSSCTGDPNDAGVERPGGGDPWVEGPERVTAWGGSVPRG